MAHYSIALLPGDGIGVEIAVQARRVLERITQLTDLSFEIDEIPCGGQYFLEHGVDWPDDADARCRKADVILLGAVGWPGVKKNRRLDIFYRAFSVPTVNNGKSITKKKRGQRLRIILL